MNYVSIPVLRHAASILKVVEDSPEMRLTCGWQSDPGDRSCGEDAEYLILNGARVSAGGDIEQSPLWFCRKHLEAELGGPAQEQLISNRIVSPEEED